MKCGIEPLDQNFLEEWRAIQADISKCADIFVNTNLQSLVYCIARNVSNVKLWQNIALENKTLANLRDQDILPE